MMQEEMKKDDRSLYRIMQDGLSDIMDDIHGANLTEHEKMVGHLLIAAAQEMVDDARKQANKG